MKSTTFRFVVSLLILALLGCYTQRYVQPWLYSGGHIEKYRAYKIQATSSLLATVKEEINLIKTKYPGYKIEYISKGSNWDIYGLAMPSGKERKVAFDVSPFIKASLADYNKMTEQDAREIVKCYVFSGILNQEFTAEELAEIDHWNCYWGNDLTISCPSGSKEGRHKFAFGYFVHRLYEYGLMSENEMKYHN